MNDAIEIGETVGMIAIPVVLFLLGKQFEHLSLVAGLAEHLGSENRKIRLIGTLMARHSGQGLSGRFPVRVVGDASAYRLGRR